MTAKAVKILFVDDEIDMEEMVLLRMRRDIRNGDYEVRFAKNGIEALGTLKTEPDTEIVVTDINMPGMDGLSLLAHLKDKHKEVFPIVVSAYGDMVNIRTAMNRGAFDFVTKPLDFQDLKETIGRALEEGSKRRKEEETRNRLHAVEDEIQLAGSIQSAILLKEFPEGDGYRVHGQMRPAQNVGGDFYDVVTLPHKRIAITVGDVSDKGIAAALFMMHAKTTIQGAALNVQNPATTLNRSNNLLQQSNPMTMFVTAIQGVYDPITGELTVANGGHPSPLIVRSDGTTEFLNAPAGLVLGLEENISYSNAQTKLEAGDTAILYSDGVTEARNPEGDEYGNEKLLNLFRGQPPASPEEASKTLLDAIDKHAQGAPQHDDITSLALRRQPL